MPGRSAAGTRRHARAEVLLETARAYAWGSATEDDVLEAAIRYGETCERDDEATARDAR